MVSLFSPQFWLDLLAFWLAVSVSFFIPGDVILGRLRLPTLWRITLGSGLGMVIFAWMGYLLGLMHMRWGMYVYLGVCLLVWVRKQLTSPGNFHLPKVGFADWIPLSLLVIGVLVQVFPMIGNGLSTAKGVYVCCGNQLDNLFHLALTKSLIVSIPPVEPGMAGALVKNYHYWFNLVAAELIRLFHLPAALTVFTGMSLLLSILYGLATLVLGSALRLSRRVIAWFIFLSYFGADALWALLLATNKNLANWGAVSSLEDGSTFLLNPPRAASMVVALIGLILLVLWRQKGRAWIGVAAMFVMATTIGFKVYTALFFAMGIGILILVSLFRRKWVDALIYGLFYVFLVPIYFPTNSASGGLFWAPFHFAHNFIVQPAFGLTRLEMAREIFVSHQNVLRIWQYELMFTTITFLSLFGTKMIAFLQPPGNWKRLGGEVATILAIGIVGSFFLGLNTLQVSGGANTFNFLVAGWLFLSLPAALSIDYWIQKIWKPLALVFGLLIIAATIPRVLGNVYQTNRSYQKFDYLFIEPTKFSAYLYLRTQTPADSLVIVDATDGTDNETPVTYAFTGRPMFLSGKGILDSHNQNTAPRAKIKQLIYKSQDPTVVAQLLIENGIDYVLVWQPNTLMAIRSALYLKPVLRNKSAVIWRVDQQKAIDFLKREEARRATSGQ